MSDKILEAVKALGGDIGNISILEDDDTMLILTKYGRYMAVPSWYEKDESSEGICNISEFNTYAEQWIKEAYMHNAAIDLEWDINNSFHYDGEKYLFRNDDTGVYVYSDDESDCNGMYTLICKSQELIDYCAENKPQSQIETPEEKEAFDMIEAKQKSEWNGEGLPPVGSKIIMYRSTECKRLDEFLNKEVEVIGISKTKYGKDVVTFSHPIHGIACGVYHRDYFKPIKSPRDKFVERLRKDLVAADYPCNLLYDWLKQLTPEQRKEFDL